MVAFHPPNSLLVGVLGGIAAIGGWIWVLRRGKTGIRLIESPKLGILNLLGPAGSAWAAQDGAALAHLFAGVRESDREAPRCDVLFLYCDVGRDGAIARSPHGLREIVRDAKAEIVVVASPNAAEDLFEAAKETGIGAANLVLTLDRKGSAFANFFVQLFEKMHGTISMPVAWVELQPQTKAALRDDHPDLVCLMERGHLTFFHAGIAAALELRRRAA